jgi:hypothetical protein
LPAFSSLSRLQKLETPTFQVPAWSTAVPTWFFRTGVPDSSTVYFTVAELDVMFETLSTFAVAPALSAEGASDACGNCEPSCSKLTRLATGVFPLKKVCQFLVMTAAVPDAAGEVAVVVGAELVLPGGVLELLLPEPPLLHAAMPPASMHAANIFASDL